jgi:WD40 repeat protein
MSDPKSYLGVMVSSTFIDLPDHRKALIEVIFNTGFFPIVMEFREGPRADVDVLDASLQMVRESAAYIGVIGGRYGQIPDSRDRNPEELSLTELEFSEAVRLRRPILLFLMTDDHPPTGEEDEIDPARRAKLAAFRERAKLWSGSEGVQRVYGEFCSLEDFWRKSAVAIPGLRSLIDVRGYRWPEAPSFEAYMAEKREAFAGREWLFAEVDQWLTSGEQRALLIRADYGVGKSAFVAEYVRRHREDTVVAWHFCRHDEQRSLRPAVFVQSIARRMAQSLSAYREAVEGNEDLQNKLAKADEDPAYALEEGVLAPLLAMSPPEGMRLLVVDSLDEALELDPVEAARQRTIADLLVSKARLFPSWLRILVTSRPLQADASLLTPLRAAFALREISAEDERNTADLRDYVLQRSYSAAVRRQLDEAAIAPEVFAGWLAEKSGGKFLYVVHVLRDMAAGSLSVKGSGSLPAGMDAFYQRAFARHFGTDPAKYREVRRLLGVMSCALEPMSTGDLAEILGSTQAAVEEIQAQLPHFVKLRGARLNFDHASLREWLTLDDPETGRPRAGRFKVNLPECQACMHAWAQARLLAGTVDEIGYLLRHLAAHLASDDERRRVYAGLLLERFEWSQARLQTSGVAGLLEDTQKITGHPDQALFQILVGNSEPVLRRSPAQWRAQVLGRLGVGKACVGLISLVSSALHSLPSQPPANQMLLPRTRSFGLIAWQDRVLEGHGGSVIALAVLPDGRVVSGSDDRTIRVWDLARGAAPQVLEGHTGSVTALAVLPDGRVVSGSIDCTVRVWDLIRGGAGQVLEGHNDPVWALTVMPDGRVVSGSVNGTIRVWDLARGAVVQVLEGHERWVSALAVLPDGRLVSGSTDMTIRVWDLARGAAAQVLEGHSDRVWVLAVLPDGRVVSGSNNGTIRVWDLARGAAVQVLEGHGGWVCALAVQPDGRVVSGSNNGTIGVWDLARGGAPQILEGHLASVRSLAVLPEGRVVSGSEDVTIRVWDLARGAAQVLQRHRGWVESLAVLPEGRVVSGGHDRTIRVWDLVRGGAVQVLEGHNDPVWALTVMPDGRVVSGSVNGTIRVWDLARGAAVQMLEGHGGWVCALAVLPDGRLVSGSDDRTIRVWNLAGGRVVQVLEGHGGSVTALAVLPDGRVVSGSRDRTIRVWDLACGVAVQVLEEHSGSVNALAVLPDGRVVSGSVDHTIRVWDLARGVAAQVLEGHSDWVRSLAVLPDGRVVSGSDDRTIRVWDLARRGAAQVLEGFVADEAVVCLAVVDPLIVAGCADGTVHFLSFASSYFAPVRMFPPQMRSWLDSLFGGIRER